MSINVSALSFQVAALLQETADLAGAGPRTQLARERLTTWLGECGPFSLRRLRRIQQDVTWLRSLVQERTVRR